MFEKLLRYVRPNLYTTTYLKSTKHAGGQDSCKIISDVKSLHGN